MTRHSNLTSLPRLTSQTNWVIDESLHEGHVQKSACGNITLFYEAGLFHVSGIRIPVYLNRFETYFSRTTHPATHKVKATLSFEYLPDARACFSQHARKYNYRTNSVTLPAEAVYAKDTVNA